MAPQINQIMTADPIAVTPQTPVSEVAQLMREEDIGEVAVTENDRLRGVITDRDLVVRSMADAHDPERTQAQDVCSSDVVTCSPQDDSDQAVRLMSEKGVRRIPVVQDDQLVGVVSIGDLAVEKDPDSALAGISSAAPNR
jgi:CBS domain-containing protein